ncbi:MAG: AraC family transcriptional regulator [Chloroflexota bacterium]
MPEQSQEETTGFVLPEVFVTSFNDLTCCASSPVHRHPFYELVWVSGAGAEFFCDFKQHNVQKNTLAFVASGQIHYWRGHVDQTNLTIIGFTLDQISYYGRITQVISDLPFHSETQPPFYTFTDENAYIFNGLFATIQDRFNEDGLKSPDVLLAYLNLILVELERISLPDETVSRNDTPTQLTLEFRKLVEEHYLQYKQVKDYAEMLGVTLNHLVETVRTSIGRTPKQIIQERLALEAKRLLIHSQDTVAEISYQLEFKTPTYFGSWFKNLEGLTPVQFRQSATVP